MGQYEDVETGLYYNRFRYYNPESGIFISSDPISILGGLNTYAYVSDSNSFTDVFGLSPDIPLARAGEDLFVGTYNQVRAGNIKSGLNSTHTPHHVVQNALSQTTHGKGITINLNKDLHELTRTYRVPVDKSIVGLRNNLAADIKDLKRILLDAGYDPKVVNRQLQELIRQNKALGGFDKPPRTPKTGCH
ncbi:RHS repeat-associated core domain-containing protein [Apibacter mensalis]|uniref:RHS repeat-associated core domain-containing protein n=1 Tax=Apibacter mensalis TaxID=1586267 RepID=UPI001C87A1A3|nr:RHS repeat-associated core domain-containing protein [Apibacter mensalis]